jgi:hypothetical protein
MSVQCQGCAGACTDVERILGQHVEITRVANASSGNIGNELRDVSKDLGHDAATGGVFKHGKKSWHGWQTEFDSGCSSETQNCLHRNAGALDSHREEFEAAARAMRKLTISGLSREMTEYRSLQLHVRRLGSKHGNINLNTIDQLDMKAASHINVGVRIKKKIQSEPDTNIHAGNRKG